MRLQKVKWWDICPHIHPMSDVAYVNGDRTKFSRPQVYNCECYRGEPCHRQGRCIKARFR